MAAPRNSLARTEIPSSSQRVERGSLRSLLSEVDRMRAQKVTTTAACSLPPVRYVRTVCATETDGPAQLFRRSNEYLHGPQIHALFPGALDQLSVPGIRPLTALDTLTMTARITQ